MKKAKIMLMGLAVCTVVSGALAFKSAHSTRTLFGCGVKNNVLMCITALYKIADVEGVPTSTLFTAVGAVACTAVNATRGCNNVHPQFATTATQ